MPEELKPVLARQMEVYAGFLEHTDHHVGRLIDALADLEILDDTLIYYIIGDNGASAEGTLNGTFNELISLNGAGGPGDDGVHGGADRQVRHPRGVQPLRGRLGPRHGHALPVDQAGRLALGRDPQRHHRPLAGRHPGQGRDPHPVPPRHRRRRRPCWRWPGCPSRPSSTASSSSRCKAPAWPTASTTPDAAERHETQYFEMFCNRGIYHQGWTAVTRHSTPWVVEAELPAFDDDVWELYDPDDWTQAHDLAAEQPEKLAELQRLFLLEAGKYNVFPLDDRRVERFNSDLAGRPQLINGNPQLLFGGMGRLQRELGRGHQEQVPRRHRPGRRPRRRRPGVIVAQGGAFGGWSLYATRRAAGLLLQPVRAAAVQGLRRGADPGRRAPGPDGVRLRRRRARQGRHRHRCTSTAPRSARAGSRPPSR